MNKVLKIGLMNRFILANVALLTFILSIPGTIALRNILAGLLLLTLAFNWSMNKTSINLLFNTKSFKNIILILFTLTIYIFFHTMFIADELRWSLSQYRSQWIYPMLYFTMGILLALLTFNDRYFNKETLFTVIFFSLFLHIIYIDFIAVYKYIEIGDLITRYGGLTESPVLANYLTNILNSMIVAELIYRFRSKNKIIQINTFFLLVILLLSIFSSIIEGMRFGVISLFITSLTGALFLIIGNNRFSIKTKYFYALLLVFICSLPLIYNAKFDSRWSSLIETIPIAIDTEANLYWQGDKNNIPKLSNGEEVSHSNYMRIAWASKGLEYISNDIFGIGFGRNIFGHAIEKYEVANSIRGYHSHSSIIDFTIGVGLIGLFLWLYFQFSIILSSTVRYIYHGNFFALFTVFITSGFLLRSLLDSNMRDHMFKQFFLILGISMTIAFYGHNKKT